jgi:3-isopropylmalate/(R)-2-methylmalate dehydratase small subunit
MCGEFEMKPFTRVSGAAVPLMMANIDTDVIIRVERLTERSAEGLRKHAFAALRYQSDGVEQPDCPLNQPQFRDAPILLAGANFGCGSSREPAVWALMALGIRAVIAESFGDIFFSNCFQNGVLAIALSAATVEVLAAEAGAGNAGFSVDLVKQEIATPSGKAFAFQVDPQRRESLLGGLDDIGQTLKLSAAIDAWQAQDRQVRPWVWLPGSVQL